MLEFCGQKQSVFVWYEYAYVLKQGKIQGVKLPYL